MKPISSGPRNSVISLSSCMWAYLLIIGGSLDNVGHKDGQKLLYSMNASGKGTILGGTVYGLSDEFGLFGPLACDGIYDI